MALEEAGAKATPVEKVKFRLVGGNVMEIRKDKCLEASEYVHTVFNTKVGNGPPIAIGIDTNATTESFEYVRLVVEENDERIPSLADKSKEFVFQVMVISNMYLFHPVQLRLARYFFRNLRLWTDRRDENDWKENLYLIFEAWHLSGNFRMPRTLKEQIREWAVH